MSASTGARTGAARRWGVAKPCAWWNQGQPWADAQNLGGNIAVPGSIGLEEGQSFAFRFRGRAAGSGTVTRLLR